MKPPIKKLLLPFVAGFILALLIAAQPKIGTREVVLATNGTLATPNIFGPALFHDDVQINGSVVVAGSSSFLSLLSVQSQLTAQDTIVAGGLIRAPRMVLTNDLTVGSFTNSGLAGTGTRTVTADANGKLGVASASTAATFPFITRYFTNGAVTINTNYYIFEYTGSTNVTWTIPLASTCSNFTCVIKNNGTAGANITITCSGSDAFNGPGGVTTGSVPAPKSSSSMYSDGVNGWMLY